MMLNFKNPFFSENEPPEFARENFAKKDFELLNTIAIIRSSNIGPVSFFELIKKYKTPSEAYIALTEKYKVSGKKVCSINDAEKELEKTTKFGAKIISVFSKEYPTILANIPDAPPILSVIGKTEFLQKDLNCIAMVGARNASALAMKFAEILAKDLSKQNLCIASGLARGIDFAAHKGALSIKENAFATIAVIAGGIDNIYPKENEKLYKQIAENGVIISENIFGAAPKADSFPRRNRIISGLSLVTILVEAAIKSGSLITAKFAAEQGREVACVPGFPLDPRSSGTNMLIKNGAYLIENANDVLQILQGLPIDFAEYFSKESKPKTSHKFENLNNDLFAETILDKPQNLQKNDNLQNDGLQNDNQQNSFLENLSANPVHIDEIIKQTNLSAAEVNSLLMEFEMEGKITRHAGNKVSLA
jgi:DNA processing protein